MSCSNCNRDTSPRDLSKMTLIIRVVSYLCMSNHVVFGDINSTTAYVQWGQMFFKLMKILIMQILKKPFSNTSHFELGFAVRLTINDDLQSTYFCKFFKIKFSLICTYYALDFTLLIHTTNFSNSLLPFGTSEAKMLT